MSKKIIIVGGGISGLTVLHHLRKKYDHRADVMVKLLEMGPQPGGTIGTVRRDGFQFETGPNGFLDSKPSTLALARELGLQDDLVAASPATKIRYICVRDVLYPLPSSPVSFFNFKPLKLQDKLRVAMEFFIPKGLDPDETVYEFGTRRLGEGFAKYFLDPMVSGIFGGNAQDLNLQYAFPRIYDIEQRYGSLLKGMLAIGFEKRRDRLKNSLTAGQPAGQLWSFRNGMGQLTEKITQTYQSSIETGTAVNRIMAQDHGYRVETSDKEFFADELILSVPAFAAADMLNAWDKNFAAELRNVPYASIAVVGLVYAKAQFTRTPEGFGYLRPTHEGKESLGVLLSSNIYPSRCPDGNILFQMMIGGACHPESVGKSDAELFDLAKNELTTILGASGDPQGQFLLRWGKAIPQYNRAYPQIVKAVLEAVRRYPHLHLLANYLNGVSLNDCTSNAKQLAQTLEI